MQEKRYEFEKATVTVVYNRIPGKAELEEACARFMRTAMREKAEKAEKERKGEEKNGYSEETHGEKSQELSQEGAVCGI